MPAQLKGGVLLTGTPLMGGMAGAQRRGKGGGRMGGAKRREKGGWERGRREAPKWVGEWAGRNTVRI